MDNWPKTGTLLFVGSVSTASENNVRGNTISGNTVSGNTVGGNTVSGNTMLTKVLTFAQDVLCNSSNHLLTDLELNNSNQKQRALLEAGTHPDFLIIEPMEKSKVIKIDQIRDFCEWSQSKPSIAKQKVAIIKEAQTLNIQASNALLKTLEEPNPSCLFILITTHLNRILPTIRSRCFIVRHRTKDQFCGLEQLQALAIDDPAALQLKQQVEQDLRDIRENRTGPVTLAQAWLKKDPLQLLYWMMMALCEETYIRNIESHKLRTTEKLRIAENHKFRNKEWWNLISKVTEVKQAIMDQTPFNVPLLIETLLIQYAEVVSLEKL